MAGWEIPELKRGKLGNLHGIEFGCCLLGPKRIKSKNWTHFMHVDSLFEAEWLVENLG